MGDRGYGGARGDTFCGLTEIAQIRNVFNDYDFAMRSGHIWIFELII